MKANFKVISPYRASAGSGPILEISEVGQVFGATHSFLTVLEDISFDVPPGEMLCILGPSGCGKTTLLKILAGFLQPSQGRVRLHGKAIAGPGPERCVVFQEDALLPWLTVAENMAFGLKVKGIARRKRQAMVERYLSLVGLSPFRDYLPREISGGMKQRVALARVLILEPEILLMDEPFAALDAQTREEMQQLLLRLWKRFAHTIVFVTHDVREAVTLADRVMVMDKNPGRIRKAVDIDLLRPRNPDDHRFNRRCTALHDLLRG
ncbi:MAG: ABC transporter ATP-binding protein [Desulfobacterales bacterium]